MCVVNMCMWVHICICVHFEFACDVRGKPPVSFFRYYLTFLSETWPLSGSQLIELDRLIGKWPLSHACLPRAGIMRADVYAWLFLMWLLDIERRPLCLCSIIMLPKEQWPSPIFSFIKLCLFFDNCIHACNAFIHHSSSSHPRELSFFLPSGLHPSFMFVCLSFGFPL